MYLPNGTKVVHVKKFIVKTFSIDTAEAQIKKVRMLRRFCVSVSSEFAVLLICGLCLHVIQDVQGEEGNLETALQPI